MHNGQYKDSSSTGVLLLSSALRAYFAGIPAKENTRQEKQSFVSFSTIQALSPLSELGFCHVFSALIL